MRLADELASIGSNASDLVQLREYASAPELLDERLVHGVGVIVGLERLVDLRVQLTKVLAHVAAAVAGLDFLGRVDHRLPADVLEERTA